MPNPSRCQAWQFPYADHALNPEPKEANGRFGGAGRDRTDDLLLAKQALSQLSYGPANASVGVGLAINLDGRDAWSAPRRHWERHFVCKVKT